MKHILVCEDELSIRSFVVVNLERAGYRVTQAESGEEALQRFAECPDIAIALLDVMLPGMDGFAVCRRLRELNGEMGIIMLTARTQEAEKVQGLQMGADDYVTKPFGTAELIARVDALYRRLAASRRPEQTMPTSGRFALDMRTRQLLRDGQPIELTQVEYQIMECFFQHEGQPVSREELLQTVWGADHYSEAKIVDVNVRRLRMKIEADASTPQHICTVWGKGYRWNG